MNEQVAQALANEFGLQMRREPPGEGGMKRFSLVTEEGLVLRRPAELYGWWSAQDRTKQDMGEVSDGYHTFNELYEHRHALVLSLMRSNADRAYYSDRHSDGKSIPGWFIVGIETKCDNEFPILVTYHLPDRLWSHARRTGAKVLNRMLTWDGHTSNDVIQRLYEFAARPVE